MNSALSPAIPCVAIVVRPAAEASSGQLQLVMSESASTTPRVGRLPPGVGEVSLIAPGFLSAYDSAQRATLVFPTSAWSCAFRGSHCHRFKTEAEEAVGVVEQPIGGDLSGIVHADPAGINQSSQGCGNVVPRDGKMPRRKLH